ncbi:TPM domain-containing protein [Hymenobacter sp. DH14]|uniref:TPM domain-containing protein n=1 Tax=Hymenobacter cyanobacteriorum TaxID=2926463 RepID=A0A9X2AI18_9BACT|nr:TPM domain-containing protein [Hymenobacter cyanobacteriorum]MCI1188170.1 TPM domain-containing protein [Hymenobacter cyanobacteriorum]
MKTPVADAAHLTRPAVNTPVPLLRAPQWWPRLLVLLALLASLGAAAQTLPPRPNPPRLVNDLAGLMQPTEADALERKLVAYDDSTSSQIAVVTVPNLDGDEIADYAQKLYESWGIGRKGKNNGILILVAQQEHQARIQTGYGLEGAVPDALAKRIISNTLVPAFRQNQYYAGLDRGTDQLIALAKGEYQANPADARPQGGRDSTGSGFPFWIIIIVMVIVFTMLRNRGGGGGRGNRGFGGGFIPPIIFGGGFGGGGGGWGGGGGGGGGFGGFGGGSSGGGGASGSW